MTANESVNASPKGWGPVSRHAAGNLKRLRAARGLSTTRLSAALGEIGHSIPPTGITRAEKGERRIDVDDLVALAAVLRVSPTALLLPPTIVGDIDLTGGKSVQAIEAWMWATSSRPLDLPKEDEEARRAAMDDHQVYSLPAGLRKWRPYPDEETGL